MKKFAKILTVALLVIVAAISVSAADVELSLTDAGAMGDYTSGVYYLDVVASDELYINVLDLKFTFNTEKIQLFCMDSELGYFPLNEEADPEWYSYAETALILGTNGKTGLQKATFSKAYVNATVDGKNCTAQYTANAPAGKVTKFPKENFTVYQIGLYIPGDVTELTAEDFKIEHMYMGTWDGVESGETYNYGYGSWSEAVAGQIGVTNTVVPEAPVITIPVLAGDKVYLQDGTVVNIDADNDAYEVPSTVGYVAVNSGIVTNNGFTAQKTYYIDGKAATAVHDNALYGTADIDLRVKAEDADRNGLRFRTLHNLNTRSVENNEIAEIGFIMAAETERFITKFGSDYDLTLDKTGKIDGVTYAKVGIAYGVENGQNVNKAVDKIGKNTGSDKIWDIRAVMYNIPEDFYQTTIACRPYYKVGEAVVYGEVAKMTLYDAAKSIKDDAASWEACNEDQQAYINSIIEKVEGPGIIVEDEVIIDISGLYK